MKYLYKLLFFSIAATCILISGCSKGYLNVNDDPDRVTDKSVTPELIFTQAAVTTGIRIVGGQAGGEGAQTDIQFVEDWIGYMSGTGNFVPDGAEISYNIDFSFADESWKRDYTLLFDLHEVKIKALQAGGDSVLAGASMILSAKVFQEMTDAFGDIPYSRAFQSNTYSHPAYDKAGDIYKSLLQSLDTAIRYMQQSAPSSFAATDIINHGDQLKWIHFANTIRLRLLLRQSQVSGFNPSSEITKIVNTGGILESGESVSVNPGYSNSQNKQSPFYGNYGFTSTGASVANGYCPNQYIINIFSRTSDPRISRFFSPASSGSYVGSTYGLVNGNPSKAQTSNFGPALIGSAMQNQWIFPSFESLFLKTEAIARGWLPGDANTALKEAIAESFEWLDVPDANDAAASYISNNSDIADLTSAGTTAVEKAKFIVFQKYLAMCCIDPREAWADERRLYFLPPGFISVNENRISNKLPVRLLYPQSEYTTNASSVLKEGTINQFTSKLFWQP